MKRERQKRLGNPDQRINLHILGSAGEVSGSLILVEYTKPGKTTRFLLDVGLHQEDESENKKKRLPRGTTGADIDFVVISHAHIDHSGWLPALVKAGFRGPVYTHPATRDLMAILLPDSGRLQEAAAERSNKRLQSRRKKSGNTDTWKFEPAYTEEDAEASMSRVKAINYNQLYKIADDISLRFTEAAHILGAAVVTMTVGTGEAARTICFTGNVGRKGTPLLGALETVAEADYVISESTYGNKLHVKRDRLTVLTDVISRAYERAKVTDSKEGAGVIIIPAFAVGRVQSVLSDLRVLMQAGRIPNMPVFLDSKMAIAATEIHRKWASILDEPSRAIFAAGGDAFAPPRYLECTKPEHSNRLYGKPSEPIIVVGSSGMAAGGKILRHLEKRLPSSKNTVVFVGYQGTGALGYDLVNVKPRQVRIHGNVVPVAATVEYMSDYSGHADYEEIIDWMRGFRKKPRKLFLVHGDPEALTAFEGHVKRELGWDVVVPKGRQTFEL